MNTEISPVLITGVAGFIGSAQAIKLIKEKISIIGIDNINSYYDKNLKNKRIENVFKIADNEKKFWEFFKISLEDEKEINNVFNTFRPKVVVNLLHKLKRYSMENPQSYIQSNLVDLEIFLRFVENIKLKI